MFDQLMVRVYDERVVLLVLAIPSTVISRTRCVMTR